MFWKKMSKNISHLFSFVKNYKNFVVTLGIIGVIITITIITSLSRVGFNMNVVYDQDMPKEAWYMKLVSNKEKPVYEYISNTSSIVDGLSGNGTKNNPYLITKPEELEYINNLTNSRDYIDNSTNNLCTNKNTYQEYYRYQNNHIYDYRIQEGLEKRIIGIRIKFNSSTGTFNFVGLPTTNIVTNERVNNFIDNQTSFTRDNVWGYNYYEYYLNDLSINKDSVINIRISNNRENSISNLVIEFTLEDGSTYTVDHNTNCEYRSLSKNQYFKLMNNLDLTDMNYNPIGDINNSFAGNFDGNNKIIKGLTINGNDVNGTNKYIGLFGYVENAVIKNVILEELNITSSGDVYSYAGSLVGYASGASKIYNNGTLSGKVKVDNDSTANTYIGGLVGYIDGSTVVMNSYNYATVESLVTLNNVHGAGVVGYRTGNNTTLDNSNPKVYLLVNYGKVNIAGGDYQFVYNGTRFDTSRSPVYCYYLWLGDVKDTNTNNTPTYAILKSHEEMIADGFKAHLNNYRYMVDYYVGNSNNIRGNENDGYSDIAYWYTKNNESYYPILKSKTSEESFYNSSNISTSRLSDSIKVNLVNPTNNNERKTYYIKITNKDELINDFTNKKIVLPFNKRTANFKYAGRGTNNGYTMTLSGWKLTSVVQDGNTYTNSISGDRINYNYVLRSGSEAARKDINTIYAEGGFYLVPDGVTEITLEAYFAYTIYVKDPYNDMVYNNDYSNGNSNIYGNTGSNSWADGRSINNAVSTLNDVYDRIGQIPGSKSSLYDVVVMLCGNFHYNPEQTTSSGAYVTSSNWAYFNNDRPFTMMSLDNDDDLEPDYSFYTRNVHDQDIPSLRFNFINVLGIPQVGTINAKLNALTLMNNSEFEVTETVKTDRIDLRHYQAKYVKLNGGYYDIYYLWMAETKPLMKHYLSFGGFAKAIYLTSGVESRAIPNVMQNDLPIFVISGGRIDTLASTYFNTVVNVSNDVYFYIDGGYINNFYTTYNASINKKAEVNVNNSYINTYYAGGHTESSFVKGGVVSNIKDSRIGELYGGPEYGTIQNGSVMNIEGSTIDDFYGSGYGGTQTTEVNLVYQDAGDDLCRSPNYYYNITNSCTLTNVLDMGNANRSYCLGRISEEYGIETSFYSTTYSKAGCASKAFATYYSSLSAANVDKVTINIKDSTINNDFYGGGNKGIVDEKILVNMENVHIKGSLYGGGRSNAQETLEVFENTNGYEAPVFISYNVDTEAVYPQKYTYTWSNDESKFSSSSVNTREKLIYSENEGKLGNVLGEIYLNIKDSTIDNHVYGGGNLSEVIGDIYINLSGENTISGNVFGGGNAASVTGNIDVRVEGQNLTNVFGGGNLGNVIGDSTITISDSSAVENIYGGGNEASVTNTNIYLVNGNVTNVFGGSNNDGAVVNSNIWTGYINPTEKKDGKEDDNPSSGGNNSDPGTTPSNPNNNYLPDLDTCKNRDINYSYSYQNGMFDFAIKNNTNTTFNRWEARIVFENITSSSSNSWSGHRNWWEGNTLVVNYQGQWYIDASTESHLAPNSTTNIFESNFELGINGSDVLISSVTITATGANGVNYTNTVCHDVVLPEPEPDPNPDPTPNPDPNPAESSDIDITVTNIFGGNNRGGLCDSANVHVNLATVTNVYGGGNLINTGSTYVELLSNAHIINNVYGGGNEGAINDSTLVELKGATIDGSAYGGGNGSSAVVIGDTEIVSSSTTLIKESLFGGGNAAETGIDSINNSTAKVYITGGEIQGNVYGGANTSKIYGYTNTSIGPKYKDYEIAPIIIKGTVFGGGEANASGSENYDFSYISVTKGIDILIDEDDTSITINGSIFGSGNASSTSGYSNIKINNFGTRVEPKKLISIQRTDEVILKNSSIDLSGTTDRTNEFNSILYSLSRIDSLVLANNSTLYIQSATNVVKELTSAKINDDESMELAEVLIDGDSITRNVDNRLYLVINKAFNIIDSENLSTGNFGKVNGMTFFGLYEASRNDLPDTSFYADSFTPGSLVSQNDAFKFTSGSYVMALHQTDHNIEENGFYSNYVTDDNRIETKYIEPTPEDAKYYQWVIGASSQTFEISLTASKFATMGTTELSLLGFETPNTYFELVSYNDNNLENEVELINPDEVPRVTVHNADAMKTFALKMSSSKSNWLTDGNTHFISTDNQSNIVGTTRYNTNNTNEIPALDFIFVHSKNIIEDKNLGSVSIGILAYVPIDEVTYEIKRIYITVNLDTKYYENNNYESSMSPGREYELFVNTKTNITSKSSLSAYYSLFIEKDKTIYDDGFHRVMISNFRLPENTRITMIDRTNEIKPLYYYYVVDNSIPDTEYVSNYNGIETLFYVYPLSNFVLMGSTSNDNNYNDEACNKKYYNSDLGIAEEEFIFIIDYSETSIDSDKINAEILLELKDSDEFTIYDTLGVSHANMVYNIYTDSDAYIDINLEPDRTSAYYGYDFNIDTTLDFTEEESIYGTIKDSNFIQNKMGLKLTMYNSNNEQINGATLIGTVFTVNGKKYYADIDGSVRINVADLVSDIKFNINVNLEKSLLPTDTYNIVVESFGSPDGLYYGLTSSGKKSILMNIINENYGLNSHVLDKDIIIDKNTGLNKENSNEITYNLEYSSQFSNPNIRVKLYRRKYDSIYSLEYESVDLKDYITNDLIIKNNNEYLVNDSPNENMVFKINLKDNLRTGTYRMTFELYNDDAYIGEVYSYMIIR